jgi:spermidine synthase
VDGTGNARPGEPETLERVGTPRGEIALRQAGRDFEIISNGVFLMDTRDGRSERLMVTAALACCRARAPRILICGLGAGFSLAEAVRMPAAAGIDVVEISPEIIGWHTTHLRHLAEPAWRDDRVTVINADAVAWLAHRRGPYDLICLDIDNGPDWTVCAANRALYGDGGLRQVRASLNDDGVVSVWSAAPAPAFERRLRRHFTAVHVHQVPVTRGPPDVIYLAVR